MKLVAIESTMIAAVGYDEQNHELEVIYRDGAVWRYRDVPEHVYQELLTTESKGAYLREFVIDVYTDYRVRRRP